MAKNNESTQQQKKALTLRGRKPRVARDTVNLILGVPLPAQVSERIARDCTQIFRNTDKAGRYRLLPPESYHVTLMDFQGAQPSVVGSFLQELDRQLAGFKPFSGRMDGLQVRSGEGFGAIWVSFQDSENETLALRQLLEKVAAEFELPEWEPKALEAHATVALFKEANLERLDEVIKGRSTSFGRFGVSQLAVYEYSAAGETPSFDLFCTKRLDLQGGETR